MLAAEQIGWRERLADAEARKQELVAEWYEQSVLATEANVKLGGLERQMQRIADERAAVAAKVGS